MEDRAEEFIQSVTHFGSLGATTLDWHRGSIVKEAEFWLGLKGCVRMDKRRYFRGVA